MAVMTGSVSASASGWLYDVWENTIRAKFSSLSARTRCIKQGQRIQWSSHQGTELELLSGAGSWSAAAASLSSLSSLSWSLSLTPSGEHGGDVSAGSPGSSGHSGGHLRLGALTGLHTQEVGYRMPTSALKKIWFPQNTFFIWFFTGGAYIMVYYILKLGLELGINYSFWPKLWHFLAKRWSKTMYNNNVFG